MRNFFFTVICLLIATLTYANQDTYKKIPKVIVLANQPHSKSLGQTSTLSQQYIQDTGSVTAPQALQGQGGVRIEDLTGNGSEAAVSLRGFGTNASTNSLIILNGIPLDNPDLNIPDLNTLNINDIANFNIINGSEGVLYGDQAVGGVVHINSKKPTARALKMIGYYGSYRHKILYLNLQDAYPTGWSYSLSGTGDDNNNYRDHNNTNRRNVFGQVNYDDESGHINFYYYFNQLKQQFAGALTALQVQQNRRQSQNNTNFSEDNHHFLQLHQESKLTEHWRLESNTAYRQNNVNGFLFGDFDQNRNIFYFMPKSHATFDRLTLLTGVDTMITNYHINSILGQTNDRQQEYSVYGQMENFLPEQFRVITGIRSAFLNNNLTNTLNNNLKNRALAVSVGLKKIINPHWEFYLRRVGNYRFPKVDENALVPKNNQGLQTQTGVSYETGLQATLGHWLSHIELYRLDLNNEIAFDTTQTPSQPFGANTNLPATQRYGLFIDTQYPILENLLFKAQYNYVDPRFVAGANNGKLIPFVSQHGFTVWADYAISNHWNFFSEIVYYSNRFPAGDYANISSKLSGYVTGNLSLRYNIQNFYADFRANNIFNKNYMAYVSFDPGSHQEFFYPAPDRNVIFTVGYKL
jgi:iron complex outermembrane receptor protein